MWAGVDIFLSMLGMYLVSFSMLSRYPSLTVLREGALRREVEGDFRWYLTYAMPLIVFTPVQCICMIEIFFAH
jgi:hypothetical protein